MPFDPLRPPPLLTADLPGVGGRIKAVPEDFEVEEIPAYPPSGQGDFLYLWIEKRDMGAEYFFRQVARRLDVPFGEVGAAGLKDRRAVTRQMVSVPARAEGQLAQLDGDGVRLLSVSRHGNKLRPGHLRGNRFRILIRDVGPPAAETAAPILDRLRREGMPNFYGPQRFGRDGETVLLGLAQLRPKKVSGTFSAAEKVPDTFFGRSPFLRKLALSAAQAALFNHALARRMADGLLRRVLPGDVMMKWPFGGLFVAEDAAREQLRFDARETVTGGPMFGRKMFAAAGEAADREAAELHDAGLTAGSFHGFGKLLSGTRRHNLIYLDDLTAAPEPDGLRLNFTLPAGSYATMLLHEVMKVDRLDADSGE
ncbi:MAG TPA: tRNA pseudouridine(13) synthase TruD [Gemmataceae bacterium]|nr:tRNA pseudouridine(13) synthase TruD [Gemmataceae bacterium]